MNTDTLEKNAPDIIWGGDESNRQYSMIFDNNLNLGNSQKCPIPVTSRREAELLLLCLRDEVDILVNERTRQTHPEIWEWIYGRTYSDLLNELKWNYREAEEVMQLIDKIPLPARLAENHIQVSNEDPEPERIDPQLVHKTDQASVLLSKPYRCGNMIYFNGFKKTTEFQIDHPSDHLDEIFIFELIHQAIIASGHLLGLPLSGIVIVVKSELLNLKNIEMNSPYLIRTVPVFKEQGGYAYCAFNIMQQNKLCVTGCFTGMVYRDSNNGEKRRAANFSLSKN
jgi:hypothetical protein